jgi:hypothetical protein
MKAAAPIAERLNGFVANLQTETIVYYAKNFAILTPPTIEVEEGSKFWKIVKQDSQRSVHCFVSKANGDIYKAATWKAPAKHVRGSIFDANFSYGKGITLYGGVYLR